MAWSPLIRRRLNGSDVYVFVRGGDNGLWYRHSADGVVWEGWRARGGVLTSAPGAAADGPYVDVFVRGGDAAMYGQQIAPSGAATGWQGLGGVLASAPIVIPDGGNLIADVFVRGSDNTLYTMQFFDGCEPVGSASAVSSRPVRLRLPTSWASKCWCEVATSPSTGSRSSAPARRPRAPKQPAPTQTPPAACDPFADAPTFDVESPPQ